MNEYVYGIDADVLVNELHKTHDEIEDMTPTERKEFILSNDTYFEPWTINVFFMYLNEDKIDTENNYYFLV